MRIKEEIHAFCSLAQDCTTIWSNFFGLHSGSTMLYYGWVDEECDAILGRNGKTIPKSLYIFDTFPSEEGGGILAIKKYLGTWNCVK